jgi:hypothetical protein
MQIRDVRFGITDGEMLHGPSIQGRRVLRSGGRGNLATSGFGSSNSHPAMRQTTGAPGGTLCTAWKANCARSSRTDGRSPSGVA